MSETEMSAIADTSSAAEGVKVETDIPQVVGDSEKSSQVSSSSSDASQVLSLTVILYRSETVAPPACSFASCCTRFGCHWSTIGSIYHHAFRYFSECCSVRALTRQYQELL